MWILKKLFTRRWWLTTLFVLFGIVLMIGLGVWQIDRRNQRTEYNTLVMDQWEAGPFNVNTDILPSDIVELEYQKILAEGTFDFENQIALNNQFFGEQPGIQLLTPMVLKNDGDGPAKAVMVARGWVNYEESAVEEWSNFDEPLMTSIIGLAQETQTLEGESPPPADVRIWYRANIEQIGERMPYELLPFFIYQLPEAGRALDDVPVRINRHPMTHLRSPFMHTSYAIQWFAFALIFGFGYTQLIRLQERKLARKENDNSGPTLAEEIVTV